MVQSVFTEIVLHARLKLAPDTDRDKAILVLEKGEKACLISASLSTPIRVEPGNRVRLKMRTRRIQPGSAEGHRHHGRGDVGFVDFVSNRCPESTPKAPTMDLARLAGPKFSNRPSEPNGRSTTEWSAL